VEKKSANYYGQARNSAYPSQCGLTSFHPNGTGTPWRRSLTGKTVLLLRGRPTGPPVHEGLHLLLRHLAILVAVHRLENPLMRRLKFLQ
jgi:hypothetical protein